MSYIYIITRCYSGGKYCHLFAKAAGDNTNYYPTIYIQSNGLFFAMSRVTELLLSFRYWLWLYYGLVYRFAANNTKALINMCDEDVHTVRLRQET